MPNEDKLSELEIAALAKNEAWMNGNITYFGYANREEFKPFVEQLKDHKVIEIGPGGHPINKFYECGDYQGVQPFKCYVPDIGGEDYVIEDGLTFLRKQADSSAIVVSIGAIDDDVLGGNNPFLLPILSQRYAKELTSEVMRVASPFAMLLSNDILRYAGKPDVSEQLFGNKGGVYLK